MEERRSLYSKYNRMTSQDLETAEEIINFLNALSSDKHFINFAESSKKDVLIMMENDGLINYFAVDEEGKIYESAHYPVGPTRGDTSPLPPEYDIAKVVKRNFPEHLNRQKIREGLLNYLK